MVLYGNSTLIIDVHPSVNISIDCDINYSTHVVIAVFWDIGPPSRQIDSDWNSNGNRFAHKYPRILTLMKSRIQVKWLIRTTVSQGIRVRYGHRVQSSGRSLLAKKVGRC